MTVTFESISPDDAKKMLESNAPKNRKVQKHRVEQYARDMKAGKWKENGEPIIFDEDGTMVNGQHRMLAIIRSNVTIRTVVVRGVEKNAIHTIDKGQPRTTAQSLCISGMFEKDALTNNRIAIAKMHLTLIQSGSGKNYSDDEVAEVILAYGDKIGIAESIGGRGEKSRRVANIAACKTAAFHSLLCGANKERLTEFFRACNNGCCIGKSDTASIAARTSLEKIKLKLGNGDVARKAAYNVTCAAINDFLEYKPRKNPYTNYDRLEATNPYLKAVKALEEHRERIKGIT